MAESLERYRIVEEVGQGGMSVVFRANDTSLEREVALKILHQHLAGQPEARARFHREARAVAKLRHPNILEIYDYSGERSDKSFIVTEFIRGRTLRAFVDNKPMPLPELAAMVCIKICDALSHAHGQGILHRDLKPENIMVRDDGTLKLMDFGIAQMVDAQSVTMTGTLLGSPAHMSPEHIEGKPLDFRADVFALGTILYFLATGALPFQGDNPHAVFRQIMDGRYREPAALNPAIGDELARIIKRAMARDLENRTATAAALRDQLLRVVQASGIEDVDKELGAYFRDPDQVVSALRPRVVSALVACGRRSLSAGKVGEAVDAFNRVLALDEGNKEVRGELTRIARARRIRSMGKWGAAAGAAMAVAGFGVYRYVTRPPEAIGVPWNPTGTASAVSMGFETAAPVDAFTAESVESAEPGTTLLVATAATLTSKPLTTAAPETARPAIAKVAVRVVTKPAAVMDEHVELIGADGKVVAIFGPATDPEGARGYVSLDRDTVYAFTLKAKHFEPYPKDRFVVPATGDPEDLKASFKWAEAILTIAADCRSGWATLEELGQQFCNEEIAIPMERRVKRIHGTVTLVDGTRLVIDQIVEAGVPYTWTGGR